MKRIKFWDFEVKSRLATPQRTGTTLTTKINVTNASKKVKNKVL